MRSRHPGFTLLEVMVAVAILGLSLSAIFSSQVGAAKVAYRGQNVSVATLLARCKMGEIEEHVMREGFPALEEGEEDECCEGAEMEGFRCTWNVEEVELPEEVPEEEGEAGAEGEGGAEGGGADTPLGDLGSINAADVQADLAGGAGIESMMASGLGGEDMIAQLAMSYAYPILVPVIQEQVRRATVTVKWKEGDREQSFDVVQYLVHVGGPTTTPPEPPPP